MAHSAPLDILFYGGNTFIDPNGNAMSGKVAFVALHGSWNRPSSNPSGRAVVALSLDSHSLPLTQTALLTGPAGWGIRPVALAVGPCKAYTECLFVSDDNSNQVIAIAYAPSDSIVPVAPAPPPVVPPPVGLNEPQTLCAHIHFCSFAI